MSIKEKWWSIFTSKWFLGILIFGLILRVVLNTAVDSFDFYAFVMWAKYLTAHRIADVFEFLPDGYTPYPPLYYYLLMTLGKIIAFLGLWSNKWLTYLIIRSPVFIADVIVLFLVYWFTSKFISKNHAPWAAGFYFLHPAIIYNTSVWGQIDSVVTLLGLLSVLAFVNKRVFWGVGFYVLGVITKLQILAILPLIGFFSLFRAHLTKLLPSLVFWIGIGLLPFVPIVFEKGFDWTWSYFFTIPNWYAYTSIYTYNLWAPFGFVRSDNTKFLSFIEYKYIGIFLFWLVALLILLPLRQKKNQNPITFMFAAFLLWYDFSFFATRIHSRYLIYSFGFFAPFFVRFPLIGILLSVLMIANFLLPLKVTILAPIVHFLNQPLTILFFVCFAFGLFILSFHSYLRLLGYGKKS